MKKILLSAVAVMAFGAAAQAQEMKFGVKAGLNIANQGSDAETEGSRMGLHIGGVAEFKLSENFSIQPELLYSMMGSKVNTITEDLTVEEVDNKLDYLTLPVLAKYYIMEGLSLEAGPYVGFLMSAKQEDTDIKDGIKSIDFGLNAGVAYDLPMGVFFQARYVLGLSDINDAGDTEIGGVTYEAPKVTNNGLQISVGYKF
ncbi:porin family protein [uncultured Flavobacterium sp.]|uniref:porin family protein n=1 Tax=uncultured Flavobacterium sp. TaxID=165435 RepID=UPI0025EBB9BF|nr:porin family protein [uncultured Flavobacterium sp.]